LFFEKYNKKYTKLRCSSKIINFGFKCCSNSIIIDHVDEIGTWGIENGKSWCIPFDIIDINDEDVEL